MKEKMIQLQLALFFEDYEGRPDRFIPMINESMAHLFDQMPTIIPIPNGAPPEIPSVILKSSDEIYVCNISRSRIDLIMNLGNVDSPSDSIMEEYIAKIRPYISLVFSLKKILRFGLIGQYIIKTENPIGKIQANYIKKDLGDLEELHIRFNKRFQNKGLLFNNIVEIGQVDLLSGENLVQDKGVFIQRDVNNVPVDNVDLKIEDVITIINLKRNEYESAGIKELLK